jgi:Sigma-70 region 2
MAVGQIGTERVFAEHRGLRYAVAYRVLGSVTEAEDVVQDAWLRWSRVDSTAVSDAEGYLVRVTTRLAVDRLRSARVRRESYVGPWLPEPMLGYSHAEIAGFTGRSDASVRQIAHRARKAVGARRHRYDTDPEIRQQVTERFLAACLGGDLNALMEVLAPDVILVSDGGGFTGAPRKPIRGIVYVARAIIVLSKRRPAGSDARLLPVNGGPGIVIYSGRTPVLALTLHLADGAIQEVHVVSNPEKLRGVMT